MRIQEIKSKTGVTAWLVEEHAVPLLALRFIFDGGSTQDPPGREGLATYLASILDEGAGDLDARRFQERMELIAMRLSFDASRDAFTGAMDTLTVNRDAAAELLTLALNAPRFDTEAVERMRAQHLASLAYAAKSPDAIVAREWFALAFPDHPYGRPARGTEATIKAITRDDLDGYRRRVIARSNLKVVAVGDIDAASLESLLDRIFGALPANASLTAIPAAAPPAGRKRRVFDLDVPQSVVQYGFPGIARLDPDFIAAYVLNEILGGGGLTSRLMTEVREKRGLAYGIHSYLMPMRAASLYAGAVKTRNDAVGQSIDIITSEIRRMAEHGPTPEELDDIKAYLTGSFALRLDTNGKIAGALLSFMYDSLGIDYVERRNAMIEALTLDDLRRVARRLLGGDDMLITVVGRPVGVGDEG